MAVNKEPLFNLLAGLSLFSWAFLGWRLDAGLGCISWVRFTIVLLNVTVGLAFLFRSPMIRAGDWRALLLSLPAFLVSGWAFKLAPIACDWPMLAQLGFCSGALIALVSFIYLGRNFAILPALRGLSANGPYAKLRHPAYLGEVVMVFSCFLAHPAGWAWMPPLTLLPLLVLRIKVEEKLLLQTPEYQGYCQRVRWRLCPGIW